MNLKDAEVLARELMARWGLTARGCRLELSKSLAFLGRCTFRADGSLEAIQLSIEHVRLNAEPTVRDTILHEIAHALAGCEAGHGPKWKRWARVVGARPETKADPKGLVLAPQAWRLECSRCGKLLAQRSRRPDPKRWAQWQCPACAPHGPIRIVKNPGF